MYQSINLPLHRETGNAWGGWEQVRRDCARLGVDGVEGIWAGEDIPDDFPRDLLVGYHLTFTGDWLDFYREDKAALRRRFGSLEAAYACFGGSDPALLLEGYRADLERAIALGAQYMVFHVTNASTEENYTFRWLHRDNEVIDAAAELINAMLPGEEAPFDFLVENHWGAGFTFTDPTQTERLLGAIRYPRTGIMLDTGHLMVTNPGIRTQAEGAQYIHQMLDRHGSLCSAVRGMHLHQSLSGAYIRRSTGRCRSCRRKRGSGSPSTTGISSGSTDTAPGRRRRQQAWWTASLPAT